MPVVVAFDPKFPLIASGPCFVAESVFTKIGAPTLSPTGAEVGLAEEIVAKTKILAMVAQKTERINCNEVSLLFIRLECREVCMTTNNHFRRMISVKI